MFGQATISFFQHLENCELIRHVSTAGEQAAKVRNQEDFTGTTQLQPCGSGQTTKKRKNESNSVRSRRLKHTMPEDNGSGSAKSTSMHTQLR